MDETSGTTKERYYLFDLEGKKFCCASSSEIAEETLNEWAEDCPGGVHRLINDRKIVVIKGEEAEIEQEIEKVKLTLRT